ncbi:hypothetical protein BO70DRAFT_405221 [Aspergillus heteromorphus CBS 117.55]|uniref:Exonuclease domain-containing protein n=1 Tax=Aspergillus heteromorphus CBS 117.55 TaxID=1448321 RepID=A0A317W6S8_9EURO|nr:uncharacterized protein BO70DRAFT_405221 [Aspergillus heteromorphus CBS 117.55]PWY82083.1 hypothetical protein BO70DRAFT_405221 [Aspergillus heteromorphus CBS 117.55]
MTLPQNSFPAGVPTAPKAMLQNRGKGNWKHNIKPYSKPKSDDTTTLPPRKPRHPRSLDWNTWSQLDDAAKETVMEYLNEQATPLWQTEGWSQDPLFQRTPLESENPQARKAVAIDCEMVGTYPDGEELVQVCLVDVLTRKLILDLAVIPTAPVMDWRTSYSGMTKALLHWRKSRGETVYGWEAARRAVFRYINADTVLVGHSLHVDLEALGILHDRVVDTYLLVRRETAAGRVARHRSSHKLKSLVEECRGVSIQADPFGHCCSEDTFGAREVLLWCCLRPTLLRDDVMDFL